MAQMIYGRAVKEIWDMACEIEEQRAKSRGKEYYTQTWNQELEESIGEFLAEVGIDTEKGVESIVRDVWYGGDYGIFENKKEYKDFLKKNNPEDCLILTEKIYVRYL